jgi:hypothetical protein
MAWITLPFSAAQHEVGQAQCLQDWCGGNSGYPKPCERDCPGLVHAAFGDENDDDDGGYWLHTKCDVCGEPE